MFFHLAIASPKPSQESETGIDTPALHHLFNIINKPPIAILVRNECLTIL